MGAAGSIESTPYDEAKFAQSKAIMESGVDDAEKFAKLKGIWAEGEAAAAAADANKKSTKELPPAGDAAAPADAALAEAAAPAEGEAATEAPAAEAPPAEAPAAEASA